MMEAGMIELEPKEVETVGANRYLLENGRLWKTVTICAALVLAGGATRIFMADSITGMGVASKVVAIILVLLGFTYYWKVLGRDAIKAGKKFREEWDKEHV
jgi:hypothetical protein